MSTKYRTEVHDPECARWVAISSDSESVSVAKHQYSITAAPRKRILCLSSDRQGKTRVAVLLDSSAEETQEIPSIGAAFSRDQLLIREEDGDVLRARPRR